MARLEVFDCKEPSAAERAGTRRLARTVVRLSDCTSVAPVGEGGPRAGTATFRLETRDRSFLFAAEKQQSEEWVAKLCQIAFPVSPALGGGDRAGHGHRCVLVAPWQLRAGLQWSQVCSARSWLSGALWMALAVVCGSPRRVVNNSWLWLQISSGALLAPCRARARPCRELAGGQVMAEERFLLAQPLLPFLPQQPRRKRSLESAVVPGSGTHLVPVLSQPGCCWGHSICARSLEKLSSTPVLCCPWSWWSASVTSQGCLGRGCPGSVFSMPSGTSAHTCPAPQCSLSLLGGVCRALGWAPADSRLGVLGRAAWQKDWVHLDLLMGVCSV